MMDGLLANRLDMADTVQLHLYAILIHKLGIC